MSTQDSLEARLAEMVREGDHSPKAVAKFAKAHDEFMEANKS